MCSIKTGFWVKVEGCTTHDGDPLWRCSNCCGSEHVYGIKHLRNKKIVCPECESINEYKYSDKEE